MKIGKTAVSLFQKMINFVGLFGLILITLMNATTIDATTIPGGSYPSVIYNIQVEGYDIGFQQGVYNYYVTLPEGTTQAPKINVSTYIFVEPYTTRCNSYIPTSVPSVACVSYSLGTFYPIYVEIKREDYYIHFNVGQAITAAPVTASPVSGAVDLGSAVTLSSETEGASICYSVNGSSERLTYQNPIIIDQNISIKAYATKAGMKNSDTSSFTYTLRSNSQYLFSGGTGLYGNPYIITTAEQLAKVAEVVNNNDPKFSGKYYKLGNDIDLSNYGVNYNAGKGWVPIGKGGPSFTGGFDGAGHKITGLYINDPSLISAGLFGSFGSNYYISTLENLSIVDANITASGSVGSIVGRFSNGSITNCSASGMVSGSYRVGGILGELDSFNYVPGPITAWIANCYATASVRCSYDVAGGVVGSISGDNLDTLINCAALSSSVINSSNLSNHNNAGRVVGSIDTDIISGAHALNNMKVTINGVDKTLDKGLNKIDGADMTMQDALTAAFWTNPNNWGGKGWDPGIWEIKDGSLPVLRHTDSILGDSNGDGIITTYDAVVVLQFVAGLLTPNEIQMISCNVNGDTSGITAFDAVLILQYVAGIRQGNPIGEPVNSN